VAGDGGTGRENAGVAGRREDVDVERGAEHDILVLVERKQVRRLEVVVTDRVVGDALGERRDELDEVCARRRHVTADDEGSGGAAQESERGGSEKEIAHRNTLG